MMAIVEGAPGAGKSFWGVNKIAETLADTCRPIFTNLPINRHRLAAYVVTCLCHKKWLKNGEVCDATVRLFESFVRRLHVVSDEEVADLHNLKMFGAVVIFDELATIFPAKLRKLPKEVHVWICQHRHGRQDVYVLSQSAKDIHTSFRRHSEKLMRMRNGLGMSITKNKYFQWARYPVQFFRAAEWRMSGGDVVKKEGEIVVHELWPYFGLRKLFGCYNSFSQPVGIKALGESVDGYDGSEDLAVWEESMFTRIVKQLVANSTMVFMTMAIIVGAIFGYRWLHGKAYPEKDTAAGVVVSQDVESGTETVRVPTSADKPCIESEAVLLLPTIDAVGLTDSSVILRNGAIWKVGTWIVVDGLECGLVSVNVQQSVYWWGVRDRTGKVISASRSQLSSGGPNEQKPSLRRLIGKGRRN